MEPTLTEILRRGANEVWNLELTDQQLAQFARYAEILVDWNATRFNLTRLITPRDIAVKHFLDSLAPLTVFRLPYGADVLDVGTGAGLPGVAWKIFRPDIRLTLLDSTAKKLAFCRAVADTLQLEKLNAIHGRAEDLGRDPNHAGMYDVVTARAVAPLATLLPWIVPFMSQQGCYVALKGATAADEIADARPVAVRLGVASGVPVAIELPEAGEPTVRQIIIGHRRGRLKSERLFAVNSPSE